MTILTKKKIEAGISPRGGYTRNQLAVLGVDWPPVKGWKKALLGSEIDPDRYELFLQLRLNPWWASADNLGNPAVRAIAAALRAGRGDGKGAM